MGGMYSPCLPDPTTSLDFVSMGTKALALGFLMLRGTVTVFSFSDCKNDELLGSSLMTYIGSADETARELGLRGRAALIFFSCLPASTVSLLTKCEFWYLRISLLGMIALTCFKSTTFSMLRVQRLSFCRLVSATLELRSRWSWVCAPLRRLNSVLLAPPNPVGTCMSLRSLSGWGTSQGRMERTAMSELSVVSSKLSTFLERPIFLRVLGQVLGTLRCGSTCRFLCSCSLMEWQYSWQLSHQTGRSSRE